MKAWAPVKRMLKKAPVIGAVWARVREQRARFRNSSHYWDRRYRKGGNSGAGSYNRLAHFKAEFLNRFVEENQIGSVVEFGCGDGAQLALARYPSYTGLDISPTAVKLCRSRFAGDSTKRFMRLEPAMDPPAGDLTLSLDVVYHLVEDAVFEDYMRRLFGSARRFVIIYSSNSEEASGAEHVRHRKFTRWIEAHVPGWRLESTVRNAFPYNPADPDQTSFSDFYVFTRNS